MAGLVPAIHVFVVTHPKTWMPATSAGMTTQSNLVALYEPPNALKVMIVRVSAMPGMVCTFSAMK